ncbi:unnamed protein product, partial [marine sediment metagenome]
RRWIIDYCLDNYSRCIRKAFEGESFIIKERAELLNNVEH